MAKVLGTVVSISLETDAVKQSGGSYKAWELVYKNQQGKVFTIAKPVQGLKFGPLKGQLAELNVGDQFTLTQEKNAQGFNDVKSVTKGWDEFASVPSDAKEVPAKPATSNSYQARDFETKEERAARQKSIVRQSSLSNAIAVASVGAKTLDPNTVLELAGQFEQWVNRVDYGIDKDNPVDFDDDVPM